MNYETKLIKFGNLLLSKTGVKQGTKSHKGIIILKFPALNMSKVLMKYKTERRSWGGQVLRRVHNQLGVYTRRAGRENEKGFTRDLPIVIWLIFVIDEFMKFNYKLIENHAESYRKKMKTNSKIIIPQKFNLKRAFIFKNSNIF